MTELAEAAPAATPIYDFDETFQRKIVALSIRDVEFAQRTDGLVRPEYIASSIEGSLVAVIQDHYKKYRALPSMSALPTVLKQAIADKKIAKALVPEIRDALVRILKTDISDRSFVIDKVSEFARHQAMEEAILKSVGFLDKRDFAAIEKAMRAAQLVGEAEDLGEYDYFKEIDTRTEKRLSIAAGTYKVTGVSTGYPEIDELLYHHGWGRKELSLLLGAAKSGKSIGLWDMAKNATFLEKPDGGKFNVLGFTCEVSAEILGDRIDANISDTAMRGLGGTPHDVKAKIKAAEAKAGLFKIHEYPSGQLTPAMIRRVIERYLARGIQFDLVVIDYLDIMAPDYRSDSNIENSKSIFLGARGIGHEYNVAVLSASQLNRDGAKAMTGKATDVAEDYNRIRIADVAISINANDAEKATKEARLYWAASRNTEEGFTITIRQDRERMKFITRVLGRS